MSIVRPISKKEWLKKMEEIVEENRKDILNTKISKDPGKGYFDAKDMMDKVETYLNNIDFLEEKRRLPEEESIYYIDEDGLPAFQFKTKKIGKDAIDSPAYG